MNQLTLPANLASRQRRSVIADATQGLGSSRGAHLSIRGGRFRLISATEVETLVQTHYVDMIIIDANDKPARVYFEGEFVPDSEEPPMCFSDNGTGPSTQAMQPQSPTCQVCPKNIRGSDTTFSGKPTTACDNRKKVAFIIPDDPAVNVYEFQIPPGSLSNLRAYGAWLGQQASGIEGRSMDIADVVTRVEFDPDKQFVMRFQACAFADDDRTMQLIQYIDENKLSDAAVGRNDVAVDPEAVKQMLLAGGARTASIAAPAQPAAAQQFTLPARPNGAAPAQIENRPVNEPGPAAPARRGRKAAEQPAQRGSIAAPFMAGASPVQSAGSGGQQQTTAAQTAATRSPSDDGGIPAFLRRADNTPPTSPSAPPRFGVGQAPPPPAAIADALSAAMSLPTRRN